MKKSTNTNTATTTMTDAVIVTDTNGVETGIETTNEIVRANKLTIKIEDGKLQGDFYRTHRHLLTVRDIETNFVGTEGLNKTATREEFRQYLIDNATNFGINYDPNDRRAEGNLRKAKYTTEDEVIEDAIAMVTPDIAKFVTKMPHADRVVKWDLDIETLFPMAKTSKGTDLALMGIEDGKYVSSGNLAWFTIEGIVTIKMDNKQTIWQTIRMELVSGQLKKFRYTQTQWNTEIKTSLAEIGIGVEIDPEKMTNEESEIGMESTGVAEETPKPKAKRTRKAKTTKTEVEG